MTVASSLSFLVAVAVAIRVRADDACGLDALTAQQLPTDASLDCALGWLLKKHSGLHEDLRVLQNRYLLGMEMMLDRLKFRRSANIGQQFVRSLSVDSTAQVEADGTTTGTTTKYAEKRVDQKEALPSYVKYLIVGGGPGGLQLGYFLQKEKRDYLVLEGAKSVGTFFEKYPRHRKLISLNKGYSHGAPDGDFALRHDWNSLINDGQKLRFFGSYSEEMFPHASSMVSYLEDFASTYGINVQLNKTVTAVARASQGSDDARFEVSVHGVGVIRCHTLVMATSLSRPKLPEIWKQPVEDGYLVHTNGARIPVDTYADHPLDLEVYRNKSVLILGTGNAAFEVATHLQGVMSVGFMLSHSNLRKAWETHYVGDLRAVNAQALDLFQLKSLMTIPQGPLPLESWSMPELLARVEDGIGIKPGTATGDKLRVIICSGWNVDTSIFRDEVKPEVTSNGKYLQLNEFWGSVNVPGLHVAGTLMHMRDKLLGPKSSGGFIHGFRYLVRALFRHFEATMEGRPWPSIALSSATKSVVDAFMARVQVSSGLYQPFGLLTDVAVLNGPKPVDGSQLPLYFEEVPFDQVKPLLQRLFGETKSKSMIRVMVLTLEYNRCYNGENVWLGHQNCDFQKCAANSPFLHPTIRLYTTPAKELRSLQIDREYGPTKEFSMHEDVSTRWDYTEGTEAYDEFKAWIERVRWVTPKNYSKAGLSDHGERDTGLPMPDCSWSKIGDVMFSEFLAKTRSGHGLTPIDERLKDEAFSYNPALAMYWGSGAEPQHFHRYAELWQTNFTAIRGTETPGVWPR